MDAKPESVSDTVNRNPQGHTWPGANYDAWREVVEHDLRGAPFEKRLVAHTYEGLEIRPLYTARDWDHRRDPTGVPGRSPLVRDARTLGNSRLGWEFREERREPDPDDLNRAILDDLEHGAGSVDLRLNDAITIGPDRASAFGAMLCTLDDLAHTLEGVHLEYITLALTGGGAFAETAALVHAYVTAKGIDPGHARLAFNADPIAELARTGHLPAPIDEMLDRISALAVWADRTYPRATAVRVNTAPYHDSCATASQDLAISMATGLCYFRALIRGGLDPARACRQMVFQYSLSTNFFLAIAKVRAARRLWNCVLEHCGIADTDRTMRIETRAGRRSLTHRDPWVNMLRNTACCFAGGVAGADTIVSVPFDEPLGISDALARRIARNTQVILSEEAHLHRVIDPAGGAWYLERLTEDLAHAAWDEFRSIERDGGIVESLASGAIHSRLREAYGARLKNIAKRKDAVTGVSEFPLVEEKPVVREKPDPEELLRRANARLEAVKVDPSLKEQLESARRERWGARRFELMARAMLGGASLGDLRTVINEGATPHSITPLAPHPYAEPFETLRDASDAFYERHGNRPSVCIVSIGSAAALTPRVNFTSALFGAGGFEVHEAACTLDDEEAVEHFRTSGAAIAVICAADSDYPSLVPRLAPVLASSGARRVLVAGRPGEHEQAFRAAGVERFVFMGCDVVETLSALMREEGVLQ
ncbi:MAG: methylmalonyl-CoA mutase family protein [Phycisphaerales bacterium]